MARIKRPLALYLVVVVILIGLSGCARFALDARGLGDPVSMTRSPTEPASVVPFRVTTKAAYVGWLFNLVNWTNPDIEAIIKREIRARNGTGVQNLTIRKEISFVDGLLNLVSFGLYFPETIIIEGEVIR